MVCIFARFAGLISSLSYTVLYITVGVHRNYLKSGEFLSIGEFIGSPSGNCYLMMTKSGLILYYEVSGCTMTSNDVGYGNTDNDQALYSIPKVNIKASFIL